ncbi:hypothetical protein LEP1GSC036_2526 [Leptospira weilii str. 2006001853]|uniref:Uncharacterized protein n=2 Tax=Leptospira weilii TaxID=28184 RepID=A0A828YY08_9LEPT|nr:hypothetical protein LEP1GSC036_2526 [Leptospira weilii str. 2006001853]EMM70438.1 hypothetical protein LEP1GSC038_1778 [Leptospira weilii str. 2006001855]
MKPFSNEFRFHRILFLLVLTNVRVERIRNRIASLLKPIW